MPSYLSTLIFSLFIFGLNAQSVVITELNQITQYVELHNRSSTDTVDISEWYLYDEGFYSSIIDDPFVTVVSGQVILPPDSYIVIKWIAINRNDGEVVIYSNDEFTNAESIQDYVQYNRGNHRTSQLAVERGVWDDISTFVPNAGDLINSLTMNDGSAQTAFDTNSLDWIESSPTPGNSNYEVLASLCESVISFEHPLIEALYYQALRIVADGTISNQEFETVFSAENAIELIENFEVEIGAILEVYIQDCLQ